ncbi:MAG: S4 domain-containing protein [Candidatus Moraniibacteriota bacterium]
MPLIDVLVTAGLAESKSDARRKIEQGGVSIEGEKLSDPEMTLPSGTILKVGKKDFIKVVF